MGLMNMFKKKENYAESTKALPGSKYESPQLRNHNRMKSFQESARREIDLRGMKQKLVGGFKRGFTHPGMGRRVSSGLNNFRSMQMNQVSQIRQGKVPFHQRIVVETVRKASSMAFPKAYKTIQATSSSSGQRGRPKGSVKYPGGVYAYRKAMRAQNALMRQQQVVQQYQQQQMQQVPQETGGYPQQMPQQQVYQPQPGEYPYPTQVAPPQREVRPVFKSSGGSPYPPVQRVPLQPATAHPGYVETVDMFSGKKSFKALPQAEAWIR